MSAIRVYIASPYTDGNQAENVRDSLIVADELLRSGFFPFASLLSHFWHILFPQNYATWLEYDITWMLVCDCVLRVPGESKGADHEVHLAEKEGIPVFYNIKDIKKYYESPKK